MEMKVTYYLEVISSWCFWAEPAWAKLKRRYADHVSFDWKLALMDASGLPSHARNVSGSIAGVGPSCDHKRCSTLAGSSLT